MRREVQLFVLALVVQVAVCILINYGPQPFVEVDVADYFSIAQSVYNGHGFSVTGFGPDAYRTPLYPLFLVVFYFFSGQQPAVTLLVQQCVAAVTVVIVYALARRFLFHILPAQPRMVQAWATVVALLFLFESDRLKTAAYFMSDTLFSFFFLTSIYLFFRGVWGEHRPWFLAYSGLLLGLATLTRPISQLLWVVLICLLLLFRAISGEQKRAWLKRLLRDVGILLVAFLSVVGPWMIRNHMLFGTFRISPQLGISTWEGRVSNWHADQLVRGGVDRLRAARISSAVEAPFIEEIRTAYLPHYPRTMPAVYILNSFPGDDYLMGKAWQAIAKDRVGFALFLGKQFLQFLVNSQASFTASLIVPESAVPAYFFYPLLFWGGRLVWTVYFMLAGLGFVWAIFRQRSALWGLCVCGALVAYFMVFASISGSTPRYRAPVNPFIFIPAAYGACLLWQGLRPRGVGGVKPDIH